MNDDVSKEAILSVLHGMSVMSPDIKVEPVKGAWTGKNRSILVYRQQLATPLSFLFIWAPDGYYVGYLTDAARKKTSKAVLRLRDSNDAIQFAAAFFSLVALRARAHIDI